MTKINWRRVLLISLTLFIVISLTTLYWLNDYVLPEMYRGAPTRDISVIDVWGVKPFKRLAAFFCIIKGKHYETWPACVVGYGCYTTSFCSGE
ncbi:hypothetical protein COT03_00245 [Candidatus Shapirobacteria bacterium CG07_land_8_20_14_0_80_39_18]|uniref:Uncharacterized protein n=2 Tax=Microgenomates group TaxID=1794810 RepID=A0A2M6YS20_9BACT|nr:MAG: hypothetical protein COT03_00245 [Candidatus Shapirobacteria bacterium CG07_land_8_20_14_0_80_39_18]PIZ48633.1 MAG: hypothetical protein COY29_03330 [Candidatus Woesebacteria bacterium CG_4_10_14_0_2_um_filter_39_14]